MHTYTHTYEPMHKRLTHLTDRNIWTDRHTYTPTSYAYVHTHTESHAVTEIAAVNYVSE